MLCLPEGFTFRGVLLAGKIVQVRRWSLVIVQEGMTDE